MTIKEFYDFLQFKNSVEKYFSKVLPDEIDKEINKEIVLTITASSNLFK